MITIGMPVYNEEKYIRETIISALKQKNCRIIISDNNSSDGTGVICKEFAAKNKNIKYIFHNENIGALKNFYFTMMGAGTEYFMWLGGHDLLSENYSEELLKRLENEKTGVFAYSPVKYIDENGKHIKNYDYFYHEKLLSNDPFVRVYAIIKNLFDCSMLHGIFRLESLKKSWHGSPCLGADHILLCKTASMGKMLYVPETSFIRRETRIENYNESVTRLIIHGFKADFKKNLYGELISEQLKVMDGLQGNIIKKTFYALISRVALFIRFKRFGIKSGILYFLGRLLGIGNKEK